MKPEVKNVKISEKHHKLIKEFCDKKGMKIYKLIEKWIDENCKPKAKDIYGE